MMVMHDCIVTLGHFCLANQSHVYREDFLMEIAMMKKLGHHPNVVSMIGCCTLVEEPCLIVEMVPHGDLLNYLRKHRTPEVRQVGGGSKLYVMVKCS